MKSPSATPHDTPSSRERSATDHVATVLPAARAHAAANDDTVRPVFDIFRNDPLWALAIGMWVFFGLMAVLIAFG